MPRQQHRLLADVALQHRSVGNIGDRDAGGEIGTGHLFGIFAHGDPPRRNRIGAGAITRASRPLLAMWSPAMELSRGARPVARAGLGTSKHIGQHASSGFRLSIRNPMYTANASK